METISTVQYTGLDGKSKAMTKKVRLKISSIAPLGDGIAINDGSFYYIPGAIPGDEVEVEITRRNKREIYTNLLHIVHPSEMRRDPPCPVFGKCGGCSLLHMDETAQINARRDALKRQFGMDEVRVVSAGPALGYRRLARLHVRRNSDGRVRLGFFEKRAHRIVDISHCPILEQRISDILPVLKTGLLRGLKEATIRIATGDNGIYLHVETATPPDPIFYSESKKSVPSILGGVVLNWDGITTVVAGGEVLALSVSKERQPILLPAGSFGQANRFVNEQLTSTVAGWAKDSGATEMLELYAGAGNFSFMLTDSIKKITMVELDPGACAVGKKNFSNIPGANIICEDATTAYQRIGKTAPLVLLDPPRTGAQEVAKAMAAQSHNTVIYVSCNPATLKRDLAYMLKDGYRLQELIGFDMFPQTPHLEAAALLKKP